MTNYNRKRLSPMPPADRAELTRTIDDIFTALERMEVRARSPAIPATPLRSRRRHALARVPR